jgi:ferritin-like metal-binding protein YciE
MSKSIDTPHLRSFFYEHLNKVYCAKSHLLERLSELEEQSNFEDLKDIIKTTIGQVEQQSQMLNQVYTQFKETYTFENCEALINFLEEIFISIHHQSADKTLRNASVLSYLYYIESVELASIRILILAAEKMGLNNIQSLLTEIHVNAKEECALILHLTKSELA